MLESNLFVGYKVLDNNLASTFRNFDYSKYVENKEWLPLIEGNNLSFQFPNNGYHLSTEYYLPLWSSFGTTIFEVNYGKYEFLASETQIICKSFKFVRKIEYFKPERALYLFWQAIMYRAIEKRNIKNKIETDQENISNIVDAVSQITFSIEKNCWKAYQILSETFIKKYYPEITWIMNPNENFCVEDYSADDYLQGVLTRLYTTEELSQPSLLYREYYKVFKASYLMPKEV